MKVETKYSSGAHIRRFADVAGLLWRAPRTVPEIADITGSRTDDVTRVVAALVEEGLVKPHGVRPRPKGKGGRAPQIYAWVERDG